MEFKWLAIAIAVMMFSFALGQMNKDNKVADCRIAALAANKTTAEIAEICK